MSHSLGNGRYIGNNKSVIEDLWLKFRMARFRNITVKYRNPFMLIRQSHLDIDEPSCLSRMSRVKKE